MTILTATAWKSNAELIEDVARLGYLDGRVLDVTYGYGTFWKNWRPDDLAACDLNPEKSPIGYPVDFTALPFADDDYDCVVYDPPYKLNGTPTETVDERYGVNVPARWQDRMDLIGQGLNECLRVSNHYVLAKCMDQVVAGKRRWQTVELVMIAHYNGFYLEDRFDMLVTPRPQPEGRRQIHTQSNYSTLLVFAR